MPWRVRVTGSEAGVLERVSVQVEAVHRAPCLPQETPCLWAWYIGDDLTHLAEGDLVSMIAFGAGLTWGGVLMRW